MAAHDDVHVSLFHTKQWMILL